MKPERPGMPIRALWRGLIRFEPRKMVPEVAIRNTIGFTGAFILGMIFASASTGVVAGLGALNVCYSDGLDPYRIRGRRMLIATLLVAAAVALGAICAQSDIAAVLVAAVWAFAAGMLVALGTTAADLGVITLVTLVVFEARPLPLSEAFEAGAVALGGGLLQTLLSTFLWPIRRYEPERRILGRIYEELARIAREPPEGAKAPPMTRQISDAQDALVPLGRDHSIEAERLVFRLVQAERIRLSIFNAGRLRRRIGRHEDGAPVADAVGRILNHASVALQRIARLIPDGRSDESTQAALEQLTADLVEFESLQPRDGHPFFAALIRDARHQCDSLRSQIRAAAGTGSGTGMSASPARFERLMEGVRGDDTWRMRLREYQARLTANLSLDSTVFRHAIRLAVCLALGDAIGRAAGLQRTYWIPMTIAIVLKPDFAGTFARGLLRIGGTMIGLILATLLFRFVHTDLPADVAWIALFMLMLRWAGPANYGIFVIAISAMVVLLAAVTGVAPQPVIAARALNTALGGSLALVAYAVWPTWERKQTRDALAHRLDTYRAYTRAVFGAWQGEAAAEIDRVRDVARRARSNAEASVDRMSGEPGVTAKQTAALAAILASSHSFVHAVMAMESPLYSSRRDPAPVWMPALASSTDRTLVKLARVLRSAHLGRARRSRVEVETPPPGTAGNELLETEADRIRTSLRSLGEELARRDWL